MVPTLEPSSAMGAERQDPGAPSRQTAPPSSWEIFASTAHKTRPEHLWLESVTARGVDHISVSFRLPPTKSSVRFAEVLEVQRQAGIVLSHMVLGVRRTDVFVLNTIHLTLPADFWAAPAECRVGTVRVHTANERRVNENVRSADLRFTFEFTNGIQAIGSSSVEFLPEAVYERVRRWPAPGLLDPLQPAPDSGRSRGEIQPDLSDPILSDHTADHVSAMAMVCAVENSLMELHPRQQICSLAIAFLRYSELSPPPSYEYLLASSGTFSGRIVQDELTKATFDGATWVAAGTRL